MSAFNPSFWPAFLLYDCILTLVRKSMVLWSAALATRGCMSDTPCKVEWSTLIFTSHILPVSSINHFIYVDKGCLFLDFILPHSVRQYCFMTEMTEVRVCNILQLHLHVTNSLNQCKETNLYCNIICHYW